MSHRLAAALLFLLARASAGAQATPAGPAESVCLGFSFGAWTPRLDWHAAGHAAALDTSRVARAPTGRGWAVADGEVPEGAVLLFPVWWPAGVQVELPVREPAVGDTIVGRAHAFVANVARTPPTAAVRAWRVPCGGHPAP